MRSYFLAAAKGRKDPVDVIDTGLHQAEIRWSWETDQGIVDCCVDKLKNGTLDVGNPPNVSSS